MHAWLTKALLQHWLHTHTHSLTHTNEYIDSLTRIMCILIMSNCYGILISASWLQNWKRKSERKNCAKRSIFTWKAFV